MNNDEFPEIPPVDLTALAREQQPPAGLEDRVVQRLKLRPASGIRLRWWQTAAAALLLLAGGFAVGRIRQPASAQPEATFVLLLHEEGKWQKPATSDEEMQRVNEYRNWARGLRRNGQLFQGTKLKDERQELGEGAVRDLGISGFFEVVAHDWNEALGIARTCPHLRYGGQVEVRQIQGT